MEIPRILDAIVRMQALVRRRQYLFDEMIPPGPEVALALYRIRRLRNPGWVNLTIESFYISEIYCTEPDLQALGIIIALIDLYSGKLGNFHGTVVMLRDRLFQSVVKMQETLQGELDDVGDDALKMSEVIKVWKKKLPEKLNVLVTDFAEVSFRAVLNKSESTLARELAACKSSGEIHQLLARAEAKLGSISSQLIGKIKIALLERKTHVRDLIRNTWSVNGSIPHLRMLARGYVEELGADDPLVVEVLADIRKHHRNLQRQMETEMTSAESTMEKLNQDLKSARVRLLKENVQREITEFQSDLEISLFEWGKKLGHSEIVKFAQKLLSNPQSFFEKISADAALCEDCNFELSRLSQVLPGLKNEITAEDLERDKALFNLEIVDEDMTLPIDVKAFTYCESEAPGTPPPLDETVSAKLVLSDSLLDYENPEELSQLIGRKCSVDKDAIDLVGRAGRVIFLDLRVGGLFEELTAQIARGGLKGISTISRLSEKDFSTYHNLKAGIHDLPKPVFFSLNIKPIKIAEKAPLYTYYSDIAAGLKPYSPPKATFTVTRSRI